MSDPAMPVEDAEEKVEVIQSFTTKEIKLLARPEFEANPDKFYPTQTLRDLGYTRHQCPKCQHFFWRHQTSDKAICGDSQCDGSYSFIGKGVGIGKTQKKISLAEAWQGFKRSLESAEPPCTAIDRYPVVARWRTDIDFVAAGIFCFQPYCVTGELEPPANPLICPQFCLRFNDLDNIGITGRHYSGFIMLGIQAFNNAEKGGDKFTPEDTVRANYRWLTEELEIPPEEITFIEDVWAGGGNLGPSIEYFVGGLELGNMVFMTYKTYPDGRREELQVKVIDVGIGLERIPWLVNGSPTSYMDVFPSAMNYLVERTGHAVTGEVWEKFGPLSCRLDVDEAADLEETWNNIASEIQLPVEDVKKAIEPVRDLYVVLDHTRTVMMAVYDGSLPSNVGGAGNVRNVLRRAFALLHKPRAEIDPEVSAKFTKDGKPASCWWDVLGHEGFLEIFQLHQKDLEPIYGVFPEFKSFPEIIELEWQRWRHTDEVAKSQLAKLTKKRKGGILTLDDWILCVTTYGLPADTVHSITKQEIPGNLWYAVAEREERVVRAQPTVLYNTAHLPPTKNLYYEDHRMYESSASILEIMPNVSDKGSLSVVALDESYFYPTSGGQEHDTGTMTFQPGTVKSENGSGNDVWKVGSAVWEAELSKVRRVVDVIKVGPAVLHFIEPPLPADFPVDLLAGSRVSYTIDEDRRNQLRDHHTATHIVFASAKKILGPHVWQNGAKKTTKMAHLDITHFSSLNPEQILEIENEANRVIREAIPISKGFQSKEEAEKEHGFELYQGGVVPGDELRVVKIGTEGEQGETTDVEACCGTHCDNTSEVGSVKILRATRISDGIVRLYFVAGDKARELYNEEQETLTRLTQIWGCTRNELVDKAEQLNRQQRERYRQLVKQEKQILELQIRLLAHDENQKLSVFRSEDDSPTTLITEVPAIAAQLLQSKGKGLVYVGDTFYYLLLGNTGLLDPLVEKHGADWAKSLSERLIAQAKQRIFDKAQQDGAEDAPKSVEEVQLKGSGKVVARKELVIKLDKKKKLKIKDILQVTCFGLPPASRKDIIDFFTKEAGFIEQQ